MNPSHTVHILPVHLHVILHVFEPIVHIAIFLYYACYLHIILHSILKNIHIAYICYRLNFILCIVCIVHVWCNGILNISLHIACKLFYIFSIYLDRFDTGYILHFCILCITLIRVSPLSLSSFVSTIA